jgi:hypothetical protein
VQIELEGKGVDVRVVFDTNKEFSRLLARNIRNMTGDLANEDCYDPRVQGNSEPLCVYRIDFRTWLLSSMPLTDSERQQAVRQFGNRPRHMKRLLAQDVEKYEAEEMEEVALLRREELQIANGQDN